MEFRVLGALEVIDQGHEVTPTAPKLREVLALLVLRNNQLVQIEALIDELWGDDPPYSALSTLQTYIYKLRKILFDRSGESTLVTKQAGYLPLIPSTNVDACRFEDLLADGRRFLEEGDAAAAARTLTEALRMWRGPALADVATGGPLSAYVTRLEESRLTAIELRIEAELRLGRHVELIGELKGHASAHQYHEGLHAKLMLALYRAGRRGEALEVYQQLRAVLVDELGVEPSARMRRLHQAVLAADPELDKAVERAPVARRAAALVTPAQLPPDIADFSGRQHELSQVEQLGTRANATGTAIQVVLITGMPGIGKTTLGVRAAHRVMSRFPDGQLFADLDGSGSAPACPGAILAQFLRAFGLGQDEIPDCLGERSKMFRTCTTAKRVLVFLDDAASAAQVAPLLPGSSHCGVIVTSRPRLSELPGARHVALDLFDTAEGVELLASIVGRARMADEPHAGEEIVQLCGRLPIAIRSAGARLAAAPAWPLAKLVQLLGGPRSRLEQLSGGANDVRARFDASYARLLEPDKGAFRMLSLLNDEDFAADRAAELLGCSIMAAEETLARLVDHHLLRATNPHGSEVHYGFHVLARLYARGRLQELINSDVESAGSVAGFPVHGVESRIT